MLIKYLEGRDETYLEATWATQQVPGQSKLHGKSLLQNKEQNKEIKQQK